MVLSLLVIDEYVFMSSGTVALRKIESNPRANPNPNPNPTWGQFSLGAVVLVPFSQQNY